MPDPLKDILIFTLVIFVLVILWAITIGLTYWDAVSRRRLPGIETAAWVALVVLIPGVGFAAYGFARLLARPVSAGGPAGPPPRRATLLKRQPQVEQRTGTIAAADFLQSAFSQEAPTQPTQATLERGARRFKLAITAGPRAGFELVLEHFPVRIGRGPQVAIALDQDLGVSRLHAEIYEQAGALRIRDLMSTHGTLLNDQPITDQNLGPGDRIRVGDSILIVGVVEERR
jgi:hypothetical protein